MKILEKSIGYILSFIYWTSDSDHMIVEVAAAAQRQVKSSEPVASEGAGIASRNHVLVAFSSPAR